ncbi:MAG: DUF4870 domain-containing protein [Bacteroidia bacterium]|jgi:uncharacterized membrane protein|nr:DUF4870 domain-containing protein [Bacteroidia bacterium]
METPNNPPPNYPPNYQQGPPPGGYPPPPPGGYPPNYGQQPPRQDKTVAIVSHFGLIGWIIALVLHGNNKTSIGAFYIRQMLGLMLFTFAAYIVCIPLFFIIIGIFLVWVVIILAFVMWIMSLISAINGEEKPLFILGKQYDQWFRGIASA